MSASEYSLSIAGLQLDISDRIPLYNTCVSCSVLRIFIPGSTSIECPLCPWAPISDASRRKLSLREITLDRIIWLAKKYRVDMVFLDGPEPLLSPDIASLVDKVYSGLSGEVLLGFRSLLVSNEIVDYIRNYAAYAVIDYPLKISEESISDDARLGLLQKLSTEYSTRLEIIIYSTGVPDQDLIANIIESLRNAFQPVIHLYVELHSPLAVHAVRKIGLTLKESLENPYVYIHSNFANLVEENTYCPYCNNVLVERSDGLMHKCYVKDSRCPNCGRKVRVYCRRDSLPLWLKRSGGEPIWLM